MTKYQHDYYFSHKEDYRRRQREFYATKRKYDPIWKEKNRVWGIGNRKKRRARAIELINRLKTAPCTDCGVQYNPWIMDWDHLGNKKANVSQMRNTSLKTIQQEISKCELVCSNCHRERTHKRLIEKQRV